LILVTAQSAWAAFYTLSTSDTVISDWTGVAPDPYVIDPSGDITRTAVDITNAWVATDGATTTNYIYFRVTANDANAAGGTNDVFGAFIDCNNDGSAKTASDVLVAYQRFSDAVTFRDPTSTPPYTIVAVTGTAADGER